MGSSGAGGGGGGGSSTTAWNTVYLAPTGALAETWSRAIAQSATTFSPTSGFLYLCAIPLLTATVVSNISLMSAGTAFTSPSHYWFGLYDNNRNQLAVTADQTSTAWGASTVKTLPIATVASGAATSFTTTYSGLHYIGFMAVFASGGSLQAAALNALNGLAPIMCGSSDGSQTTPPAFPHQAGTISSTGLAFFYSYVS